MSTLVLEKEAYLGPESEGLLMSPRVFDALEDYDENYQYELVNGVIIVSPIPLPQETGPNELLGVLLWLYQDTHPQGKALNLTLPQQYVATKKNTRRIADRLIWAGLGRKPYEQEKPSIAVELVSRRKRDRQRDYVDKRKEYMAIKIPEYWILDRFQRTLTVFRHGPDGVSEQVTGETETYETPLLPGFQVPVGRLLAAADEMFTKKPRSQGKKKRRGS
jgi:Uma2 family endonuclease